MIYNALVIIIMETNIVSLGIGTGPVDVIVAVVAPQVPPTSHWMVQRWWLM